MDIAIVIRENGIFLDDGSDMPVACHWFAKCPNQAVTMQAHPVLGDLPVCQKCADWCERMSK